MQINASLGSHTLALFGASSERSDNPLISPDAAEAKGTAATKYTVAARAEGAGLPQAELAPQDSASSYRPSINPDFVNSTYTDPRMSSSPTNNAAAPAYDGPSYTELAGGDLLGKVMSDLDAIKNNQLAAMKEEFQARVEATIGRELTEDEDVYDFHTQAIISNDDWQLGQNANSLETRLWAAEGGSTSITRAVSPVNQGLSEDELTELVIQSRVESQILSIQTSIAMANDYSGKQAGSEATLLPTLSDDEIQTLREDLLKETRSQVEQGELQISFDYSRVK